MHDGVLLKGLRIIIPTSIRAEMKQILHQGHFGIELCKRRARQSMYWPGINSELEELIHSCSSCLDYQNRLSKEPFLHHDIPDAPWIKVAADIFTIAGRDYLLVVDYHSKFVEVAFLKTPADSPEVIKALKKIFSHHGIPVTLFSDGGPQFTSKEFQRFTKEWDFNHDDSSPHYPQSNGLVERAIQTTKKSMKKSADCHQDPYLALLAMNSIPHADGSSAAFKLYSRHVRSTLPTGLGQYTMLTPIQPSHSRRLPPIQDGTSVRLRTDTAKSWKEKGVVLASREEPRSYSVINAKGNVVRRNRRQIIQLG